MLAHIGTFPCLPNTQARHMKAGKRANLLPSNNVILYKHKKMNLTELIEQINNNYKQSEIRTKIFDFECNQEIEALQPIYFYRGECNSYPDTVTTLVRLLRKDKLKSNELQEYIHVHYNLYLFLREAIFGVSCIETSDHGKPCIELFISGILQHYGFDTSFIDVTSNLKIAANFASMNNIGSKGKILVIESKFINDDKVNYYFDLTRCPGSRPKTQSSFVIWDQFKNLNLKDENFLLKHNGIWLDFELTKEDKEAFCDTSIRSVKNDEVSNQLNEWMNYSSFVKQIKSSMIKDLLNEKFSKLNKL
jgi:hypothetical protein